MKNTYVVHESALSFHPRPREKLQELGPQGVTDQELLQILLGAGSQKHPVETLAKRCQETIDQSRGGWTLGDLKKIHGIGLAKAAQITAALEFARRQLTAEAKKIRAPSDVYPLLQRFADRKQETFLAVSLNGAQEAVRVRIITLGLVNRTMVHPREVFSQAIQDRAVSLILAHNHPSGHLEPSREDHEITRRLRDSGKLLGIEVVDHLIFSAYGYYSFLENGNW